MEANASLRNAQCRERDYIPPWVTAMSACRTPRTCHMTETMRMPSRPVDYIITPRQSSSVPSVAVERACVAAKTQRRINANSAMGCAGVRDLATLSAVELEEYACESRKQRYSRPHRATQEEKLRSVARHCPRLEDEREAARERLANLGRDSGNVQETFSKTSQTGAHHGCVPAGTGEGLVELVQRLQGDPSVGGSLCSVANNAVNSDAQDHLSQVSANCQPAAGPFPEVLESGSTKDSFGPVKPGATDVSGAYSRSTARSGTGEKVTAADAGGEAPFDSIDAAMAETPGDNQGQQKVPLPQFDPPHFVLVSTGNQAKGEHVAGAPPRPTTDPFKLFREDLSRPRGMPPTASSPQRLPCLHCRRVFSNYGAFSAQEMLSCHQTVCANNPRNRMPCAFCGLEFKSRTHGSALSLAMRHEEKCHANPANACQYCGRGNGSYGFLPANEVRRLHEEVCSWNRMAKTRCEFCHCVIRPIYDHADVFSRLATHQATECPALHSMNKALCNSTYMPGCTLGFGHKPSVDYPNSYVRPPHPTTVHRTSTMPFLESPTVWSDDSVDSASSLWNELVGSEHAYPGRYSTPSMRAIQRQTRLEQLVEVEIFQIQQKLRGLDEESLRRELRKLQLKWHPDKNKQTAEREKIASHMFEFVQQQWNTTFASK